MSLEETIAAAVREAVRSEFASLRQDLERLRGGSPASDVMDTSQAAAYVGRSAKTIRVWIAAGMPATRKGSRITVRRDDLDRWRQGAPDEERAATAAAVRRLTGTG